MSDQVSRIYLIGIDGATWNVMDPMLKRGELPNFKRIIGNGVRGDLRSLEFTASPRVWTSIATGKSEDKHAIFDFYNTIKDLKAKRIWDILKQEKDETANIFYWYLTWPPEQDFKDIMVPGFLARDTRTVPKELGFLKDIELTQKMKLQESYDRTGIFYYLRQAVNAVKNGVKLSTMLKAISFLIGRKLKNYSELDSFLQVQLIKYYLHTDVFYHLLKTHPTNFSAIMLPQTDQLGHKFWSFMDPEEFEKRTGEKVSEEDRKKYGQVIWNTYKAIDKFVGKVYDQMRENDLLIIISDHGFGLVNEIYASLKVKSKSLLELINLSDSAHCVTIGSNYIIQIDNKKKLNEIDQIASILREIKIVEKEQGIFNVRPGEKEIVLELQDLFLMNIKDAKEFLNKKVKVGDKIVDASSLFVNRSDITGVHEEVGILVMTGKNIRENVSLPESHVFDIMPTILYLKNLPIGRDMDGDVINQAIEKNFLDHHPIEFIDTYETSNLPTFDDAEDYEMTEELESRLKSLGYIE